MRISIGLLVLTSLFGLAGCASAEKIRSLRAGMTPTQVSDQAGNPETIRRQGEQVVWFYRTDDGRCAVVFETEKVSSFACSTDEAGASASGTLAVSAAAAPPPVFIH